ncbi:MAG: NAD-dependent dehydratase [Burkholderiaceae bacterium]|jgi:uncharacterized protein YbjT (DUF2867 family)|nr:NAD-dependent dehydratase [Burkholderiaceae bacterium]
MPGKTGILIGATGLVGGHCLNLLLRSPDYDKVVAVSRRPLAFKHPKLIPIEIPSFEHLGQSLEHIAPDDAFCCLGTTASQAGTRADFQRVDHDYALAFAHRMLCNGARHFLLVSAIGAQVQSPVFYNRVKGLLEQDVIALGFARTSIFRPSLLQGDRHQVRPGEAIGSSLSTFIAPFLLGPLRALHPIRGTEVAAAMVACAGRAGPQGASIYRYNDMQALRT